MQLISFERLEEIHNKLSGNFKTELNGHFDNICNNYKVIAEEGLKSDSISSNLQDLRARVDSLKNSEDEVLDDLTSKVNAYMAEAQAGTSAISDLTKA